VTEARRQRQRFEALCAAAIRALAGEADLHLRGARLYRGDLALPFFAPHLVSAPDGDRDSLRGGADGLALRIRFSDAALHGRLCPVKPVAHLVFELLEQFRVESLAPPHLAGVRRNLRHGFEQWSAAFTSTGLVEGARGVLLFTVAQVCRSHLFGEPVPEIWEDAIEATRAALIGAIGHDVAALRGNRHDQRAYGEQALTIAHRIAALIDLRDDERADVEGRRDHAVERAGFDLLIDVVADGGDASPLAAGGATRAADASDDGNRVFTAAYDQEVAATDLVRGDLLREYRAQLDRRIAESRINVPRLARRLRAVFVRPGHDGWDDAQEDGRIDRRRLAQLVSSPAERRVFVRERDAPHASGVATILIDCSGSMRQHVEAVAILADVLARALELAGAACEVLGFTTAAWNGGRAYRDWMRGGRPPQPGRLAELRHIVFKDAATPWRRARAGIAALLKADLFRESIDGEAIDWACRRLAHRAEERRLVLLLSDGCPMDAATHLANDEHYLDRHLQRVVQRHERAGSVELYGLGVGLDVNRYFRRSLALDLATPAGNRTLEEIVALIARRGRVRHLIAAHGRNHCT
jgi:cobaltochelatase CobT